jgi:hypothetical protein
MNSFQMRDAIVLRSLRPFGSRAEIIQDLIPEISFVFQSQHGIHTARPARGSERRA